jgi:transposase
MVTSIQPELCPHSGTIRDVPVVVARRANHPIKSYWKCSDCGHEWSRDRNHNEEPAAGGGDD